MADVRMLAIVILGITTVACTIGPLPPRENHDAASEMGGAGGNNTSPRADAPIGTGTGASIAGAGTTRNSGETVSTQGAGGMGGTAGSGGSSTGSRGGVAMTSSTSSATSAPGGTTNSTGGTTGSPGTTTGSSGGTTGSLGGTTNLTGLTTLPTGGGTAGFQGGTPRSGAGTTTLGGTTSTGGRGTAGATGGAGSTGATSMGTANVRPVTLFDFGTGDQGWVFNSYQAKNAAGDPVRPFNLAVFGNLSPGDLDAGVAAPTLAADSTVGDPPGSLKVVVTFTGYDQLVNPNINWGQNALQDWNGKTVSVRLKVDPFPSDTTNIGGILVYANDPTYSGQYSWMAFPTDNGWHTYTLDMTQPPFAVDPTKIIQFTVELASASAPTEDAGVLSFSPITVTAYIDTITVQ